MVTAQVKWDDNAGLWEAKLPDGTLLLEKSRVALEEKLDVIEAENRERIEKV